MVQYNMFLSSLSLLKLEFTLKYCKRIKVDVGNIKYIGKIKHVGNIKRIGNIKRVGKM